MGKSWKDRPGKSWSKNYKKQKHLKKERSWNEKNFDHHQKEKYSPFDDSQEYHESFS